MFQDAKLKHERALDGLAQLESRLTFRLAVLNRLLDRQLSRILARYDLTLAAYRVLLTVDAFVEVSGAELTRYVVVDKGLVSRRAADLEKAGLIAARIDPSNARRKLFRLTGLGRDRLAEVEPVVAARQADLAAQLANEELQVLNAALGKLTNHVSAQLDQRSTDAAA